MASRLLSDLDQRVYASAVGVVAAWKKAGHDVLVTCTFRSNAEQDALYAQGRTLPGPVVTHAKAGESYHNTGLAIDFVPVVGGKLLWDSASPIWEELAGLAKATDARIVWGGEWPVGKQDRPHIEWHLS